MNAQSRSETKAAPSVDVGLQSHMNKVYGVMSRGLLLTFGVAWGVGSNEALFSLLRNPETNQANLLGWIVMLLPLAMVLFSGKIWERSAAAARTFFYALAAVLGLSLSWIFAVFTGASITQVFLITAISFAGLSLWGYTTKKDISAWGNFLIMGLIGIILASIINIFFASSAVMFAVNVLGVLIFAGLTAYDTQKIKQQYLSAAPHADKEGLDKLATLGALELFLDCVNLFVHLLQLLGQRK